MARFNGFVTKTKLSTDKNGFIVLTGKMTDDKIVNIYLKDKSGNPIHISKKDEISANLITLIKLSNDMAIKTAKKNNANDETIKNLEKYKDERVSSFTTNFDRNNLGIVSFEGASGYFDIGKIAYILSLRVEPVETKKGIYYPLKPVEINKNGKENTAINMSVYAMVCNKEDYEKLSDNEKANLNYKDNPKFFTFKLVSLSDVLNNRIDYKTVMFDCDLAKGISKTSDLKKAIEVNLNSLKYAIENFGKNFTPKKSDFFDKEKDITPKLNIKQPYKDIFNMLEVGNLKELLGKTFETINKRLEKQNADIKSFFIPMIINDKTVKIDHTNLDKFNSQVVSKVWKALLKQFDNKLSNLIEFMNNKINKEAKIYTDIRNTARKNNKTVNSFKQNTTELFAEKLGLSINEAKIKEKEIETYLLSKHIDNIYNSKDIKAYEQALYDLVKNIENYYLEIPKVSFPLKTAEYKNLDNEEYMKKVAEQNKTILTKMAEDLYSEVAKLILRVLLNKRSVGLEEIRDNISKIAKLDYDNKKITWKENDKGYTKLDEMKLNVLGEVTTPKVYKNKEGKTVLPTSYNAYHIDKDFSIEHITGIGGRQYTSNHINNITNEILGLSMMGTRTGKTSVEVDYKNMPKFVFNPASGENELTKSMENKKRKRRTKAEMEEARKLEASNTDNIQENLEEKTVIENKEQDKKEVSNTNEKANSLDTTKDNTNIETKKDNIDEVKESKVEKAEKVEKVEEVEEERVEEAKEDTDYIIDMANDSGVIGTQTTINFEPTSGNKVTSNIESIEDIKKKDENIDNALSDVIDLDDLYKFLNPDGLDLGLIDNKVDMGSISDSITTKTQTFNIETAVAPSN